MLINNHFIFVHLPKTGGSWIREVMHFYKKFAPSHGPTTGHAPLSSLRNTRLFTLPALCFVRNPWDWYYSGYLWLHHNLDNKANGWALPSEQWGAEQQKMHEQLESFDLFVRNTMPLTERYHHLTDHDSIKVHTRRMEDGLGEGLLSFLDENDISYDPALVSHMKNKLRANRTPTRLSKNFVHHYSEKLREVVQEKDAELIERFGYRFENPC